MAVTITRSVWIDDDGTGTTGTVINQALHTTLYNEIDTALAQLQPVIPALSAAWTPVPFNAANYVGTGGMTWTVVVGNVVRHAYQIVGKSLDLSVHLNATTVGGTPSQELRVLLPAGMTVRNTCATLGWDIQHGTAFGLQANGGAAYVSVYTLNTAAWPAGALAIGFAFRLEIT